MLTIKSCLHPTARVSSPPGEHLKQPWLRSVGSVHLPAARYAKHHLPRVGSGADPGERLEGDLPDKPWAVFGSEFSLRSDGQRDCDLLRSWRCGASQRLFCFWPC